MKTTRVTGSRAHCRQGPLISYSAAASIKIPSRCLNLTRPMSCKVSYVRVAISLFDACPSIRQLGRSLFCSCHQGLPCSRLDHAMSISQLTSYECRLLTTSSKMRFLGESSDDTKDEQKAFRQSIAGLIPASLPDNWLSIHVLAYASTLECL